MVKREKRVIQVNQVLMDRMVQMVRRSMVRQEQQEWEVAVVVRLAILEQRAPQEWPVCLDLQDQLELRVKQAQQAQPAQRDQLESSAQPAQRDQLVFRAPQAQVERLELWEKLAQQGQREQQGK